MTIFELAYPLKLLILKAMHIIQGYEIINLNDENRFSTNAIYAFNHSCFLDIPISLEVIKRHCYILMGVQNLRIIDKLFLYMNGVVWVDRHNAKIRNDAARQMTELLKKGKSIIYFPEGTWNLHPAKPMLPMYWGGGEYCTGIELSNCSGVHGILRQKGVCQVWLPDHCPVK